MTIPKDCKRLAEVDFPIAAVSKHAAQLEALITAISESGAIAYSLAEATHFVERSLAALSELPATSERASLEELARYIVERRL
jgi:geranylgeranyl pyrophosphate synthase